MAAERRVEYTKTTPYSTTHATILSVFRAASDQKEIPIYDASNNYYSWKHSLHRLLATIPVTHADEYNFNDIVVGRITINDIQTVANSDLPAIINPDNSTTIANTDPTTLLIFRRAQEAFTAMTTVVRDDIVDAFNIEMEERRNQQGQGASIGKILTANDNFYGVTAVMNNHANNITTNLRFASRVSHSITLLDLAPSNPST